MKGIGEPVFPMLTRRGLLGLGAAGGLALAGCGGSDEAASLPVALQERLQQMERDMVRDLQKEKTLGGD